MWIPLAFSMQTHRVSSENGVPWWTVLPVIMKSRNTNVFQGNALHEISYSKTFFEHIDSKIASFSVGDERTRTLA